MLLESGNVEDSLAMIAGPTSRGRAAAGRVLELERVDVRAGRCGPGNGRRTSGRSAGFTGRGFISSPGEKIATGG